MPYGHGTLLASSRRDNEDRAEVFEHEDIVVAVVADDAGGLRGGAAASAAVVAAASGVLSTGVFDLLDGRSWSSLLLEVDGKLFAKAAGETTAVIVAVGSHGVVGACAGDSQAWVIQGAHIDELTEGQKKMRLGSGRATPIALARPRLEGVLVVATDGLFNYAPRERIASIVAGHEPEQAAERLRALVQLPSGRYQDDLGVVVVTSMAIHRTRL